MENNLCSPIKPAAFPGCDENHVNQIKTIEVDVNDGESIKAAIEESKRTGYPILIDGSKMSVASAIYAAGSMAQTLPMVPIVNPRAIPLTNAELPMEANFPVQKEREKNRDLQFKELEAADIPDERKKLIAAEYMRLRKKYPTWKAHRLIRKAGEKYNVKFEMHA